MQLPGPCGGVLLFVSESQGERGVMRKRTLMMVLGKFEREICIALLTSSHSLAVAALFLPKISVHPATSHVFFFTLMLRFAKNINSAAEQ